MADQLLDGRYRLVRLLGRGGMGEVWQARDDRIGREVAVKIVTAGGLSEENLARFDREARIIGGLSGPSIVTVHDYGHDEYAGQTVPYLVMELVAGRTIADRVRGEGPVSPQTALAWAAQICQALTVAHTANVVHRDIKPSNVMVSDAGVVKVLDFGIARFMEHQETRTGLTEAGMVIGSAEYMSPEQAQGRHVDARSDLYSLGGLVYFALTGRRPFEADSPVGMAYQHVTRTPEAPSRYRQGIPRSVDALVLALLAKDPQDRPADARAAGERIRGLLATAGTQESETVELPAGSQDPTEPLPARGSFTPPNTDATKRLPSGGSFTPPRTDFWAQATGNAPAGRSTAPAGTAALPRANPSRRGFLVGAATVVVAGTGAGTWLALGHGSKSSGGAPAVHGATSSPSGSAPLADPVQVAKLTAQRAPVNHVAFSPDSKILVGAAQDNTARLYDVSDPTRPKSLGVCVKHTALVFDVAVSPDGHTLATSSHDQSLGLWDIRVPSSPVLLHQVQFDSRLAGVRFSPDGAVVAVGMWNGEVQLITVRQPANQSSLNGHTGLVYGVAFSPDGKTLATGSFDTTVKLWDTSTGQVLGTATGHTGRVFDIAYHPGGKLLAAGSADHSLIVFDVSDPASPSVLTRIDEPDEATGVAFRPDGRMLANGGGASKVVRLYDVTTPASPHELAPLSGHTDYALGVAFSPDGKLLACSDQDSSVLLWRF